MKGEFRKPLISYPLFIAAITIGSILSIRFGLWSIDALKAGRIAESVLCLGFVAFGLIIGGFSIYMLTFNKGAYLTVENNRIDARFGFESEIHAGLSDLKKAGTGANGQALSLTFAKKTYVIPHLKNANDILRYLYSENPELREALADENAAEKLRIHNRKSYICAVLDFVFLVLMFANIAWCVFLTEGRDTEEFTSADNRVFLVFAAAELITVILLFVFARKTGKIFKAREDCKASLLFIAAKERKKDQLERYPDLIEVKYFYDYSRRIVIYATESGAFAYMLEMFDISSLVWTPCFGYQRACETLSELYDYIKENYDEVIFDD